MTIERMLELLNTERTCILRADNCDRDCGKCELVQDSAEILTMFDAVMEIVKAQEPIAPKLNLYETPYGTYERFECRSCGQLICQDTPNYCSHCGRRLKWD